MAADGRRAGDHTAEEAELYDIHDIALSLASLNSNADITGELVDVGAGRPEDFAGKDLTGKFVLSSRAPSGLYPQAMQRGAIGVLGVSAIGFQRAVDHGKQCGKDRRAHPRASSGTPEAQRNLSAMMQRGQKITLHSITKSAQVPSHSGMHAEIPGNGSDESHDLRPPLRGRHKRCQPNSGCALLEIGRTMIKLIRRKLPRPKRTINFRGCPARPIISTAREGKGDHRNAQLRHGGDPHRRQRSYWVLRRTPDTFPSYLNDIAQAVADIARARAVQAGGYAPTQPVESPRGSKTRSTSRSTSTTARPIRHLSQAGSGVMFITWPDM